MGRLKTDKRTETIVNPTKKRESETGWHGSDETTVRKTEEKIGSVRDTERKYSLCVGRRRGGPL